MVKQVDFSTLDSAATFIKDLIELEEARIQSVEWEAGRTKIILSFPSRENTLYITIPYYTPVLVLEAISEPPGFD